MGVEISADNTPQLANCIAFHGPRDVRLRSMYFLPDSKCISRLEPNKRVTSKVHPQFPISSCTSAHDLVLTTSSLVSPPRRA